MTISTRVYNDQAVAAVNRLTGDLQKIQGQISSGKTTSRASDNPTGAVNASFIRDQKQMLDRYETITLARKKIENGKLGGQMAILFRKDIIPFVKAYALSVKDKSTWGTSKSIKKWIVNNTAHTHFHCTYDAYLNENMHPKWIAFARGTNKPKLQPSVKFECLNSI